MDTGRWGPGERIVFEPFAGEAYEEARTWIAGDGILHRARWVSAATKTRFWRLRTSLACTTHTGGILMPWSKFFAIIPSVAAATLVVSTGLAQQARHKHPT
jgi:hypothetical protein